MKKAMGCLSVIFVLLTLLMGCGSDTVFQKFDGLDTVSRKGLTDIWDEAETITNDLTGANTTVTILESYYNHEAIWIGYKLEGREIIRGQGSRWSGPWFFYSGEKIENLEGKEHLLGEVDGVQYGVAMIKDATVSTLPDVCSIQMIFFDTYDSTRTIELEIMINKKDHEVEGFW